MSIPLIHVTEHAIERAIERLGCQSEAEAQALLSGPAIRAAADFGARFVRLATGQRIVLKGATVLTVLPAENFRKQIGRVGLGRYGKFKRGERRAKWEREE